MEGPIKHNLCLDSVTTQDQKQTQIIGIEMSTDLSTTSEAKSPTSKEKRLKGSRRSKTYNSKWENDPLLKTWISRHKDDRGKVVCSFCQSVIRAHKNDLLEHSRTLKHQRNFMQTATPEDYNQFVVELNGLRKENNAIAKKRLTTSPVNLTTATTSTTSKDTSTTSSTSTVFTTARSENSMITFEQPTITVIAPRDCTGNNTGSGHSINLSGATLTAVTSSILENTDLALEPGEVTSLSTTTNTFPSLTECVSHPNNMEDCIRSNCVTSVPTFLNLTSNTSTNGSLGDVLDSDGLWSEGEDFISAGQENEDFIAAESPRDLVSVILEEQQSPTTTSSSNNNNSNGKVSLISDENEVVNVSTSVSELNTLILDGISTNITGLNVNLNLLGEAPTSITGEVSVGSHGTVGHHETDGVHILSPINDHQEANVLGHETLLLTTKPSISFPFTFYDVRTAIEEGHFTFSDLCSLARAAVNQIERCINPPLCSSSSSTNGITFCSTSTNSLINPSTSLSILNPDETHIHPVQPSNNFSFKRERPLRKRRSADQQVILSKLPNV